MLARVAAVLVLPAVLVGCGGGGLSADDAERSAYAYAAAHPDDFNGVYLEDVAGAGIPREFVFDHLEDGRGGARLAVFVTTMSAAAGFDDPTVCMTIERVDGEPAVTDVGWC